MIPYMNLKQRLIAWLLWKLEASRGFGAGFENDLNGAQWLLNGNERLSYSMSLLRDYYYRKRAKEHECK